MQALSGWCARAPLLVGARVAIDCEVEDTIEWHSHGIVIGRVRELRVAPQGSALAYWRGDYVAIDRDEDFARLAEVSFPARRLLKG